MTDQVKSDAEIEHELNVRLLHDQILLCPPGHPMRAQLLRDYEAVHQQKFGTASPITGGGLTWSTKTGYGAKVLSREDGGRYRIEKLDEVPEVPKK